MALAKDSSDETFLKNRAVCEAECIKFNLDCTVTVGNVKPEHLDMINRALRILPDEYDKCSYLNVKAGILDRLGDPVKVKICRALAVKHYDEVMKLKGSLKNLNTVKHTLTLLEYSTTKVSNPLRKGWLLL